MRLAATLGVLGILAAGCGEPEPEAQPGGGNAATGSAADVADVIKPAEGAPKTGGTLIAGLDAESEGWDPTTNRMAAAALTVARSVYDPLVVIDANLQPKPYLAESFTPSNNFQTWDVKLRPNIKFHNGQPLDSAAVKKYLDKFKSGSLGSALAQISSFDIVDPLTVRMQTTMPWSTLPITFAVQPGLVPAPGQLDAGPDQAKQKPIGTGPFKFVEWVPNKNLIVEKNTEYWRKGLPYLDKIDFRPVGDDQTRYQSFKAGSLDVMITPREQSIQNLAKDAQGGAIQVVRAKGDNDVNMLMFNTSKPPFSDIRLRQAVAYGVDRSQLLALTNSPDSLAADSIYAKDSKWYVDSDYPKYDPEKAKSLVKAVEAETGPITVKLDTVPDQDLSKSLQVYQQLMDEIGIKIELAPTEQANLISKVIQGDYALATWRQFGSSDPDGNYVWFHSSNATGAITLNMARNKDPEIDKALEQGRATQDETKRKEIYGQLQKRLAIDLPYVFSTHLRWTMGAQNNVRGLEGGTLPDNTKSAGLISGIMPLNEMWKAS